MINESEMDNILVHQKNAIIEMINNRQYIDALKALNFVKELWTACHYEYKYTELVQRLERSAPWVSAVIRG